MKGFIETETFYGAAEYMLEEEINRFFDQPGTKYIDANHHRDDDGYYVADVTYSMAIHEEELK